MTTIAFRDGVIAGDSQGTGGSITDCSFVKVARNAAGDLIGVAGEAVYCDAMLQWFTQGEASGEPVAPEQAEAFIVRASSPDRITIKEKGGGFTVSAPYYAVGSGKAVALGAMAFGSTATQAVECAAKHDIYTGGAIVTLTHMGEIEMGAGDV